MKHVAVVLSVAWIQWTCTPIRATERAPNVVFLLADDLGWADLGCYGSALHETPRLDRLAEQGVRFTNAYAAAALCSPTRASILSGRSARYSKRSTVAVLRKTRFLGRDDLETDTGLKNLTVESCLFYCYA